MARTKELPPAPANPEVSPPAIVQGEEEVRVPGLDGGPALEARMRVPATPTRAVLLCHPHPLYGGTMHSAVVLAIARMLRERGETNVAHLRFNYRGVGTSEGSYAEGRGETEDARAALRFLRARVANAANAARMANAASMANAENAATSVPVTVCGYSFGTFVGLRAAVIEKNVDKVVLIAPAVRLFSFLREDGVDMGGRLFIAVGDQDEFCDVADAEELAKTLGAKLRVFEGADHYFLRSRRKLAEAVYPEIVP